MAMSPQTRKLVGVIVLIVVVMAPAVVLAILGYGVLAATWVLPAMAGVTAGASTPSKLLVPYGAFLGVAGILAIPGSDIPWLAAAVMLIVAGATSFTAQWGYNSSLVVGPITLAFTIAAPPTYEGVTSQLSTALLTGLVLFAATTWGALLTHAATRSLGLKGGMKRDRARSAIFATVVSVEVAITAWVVVYFNFGHSGAWVMLTLLVVIQPTMSDSVTKGLHRAAGTVLGVFLAMVIAFLVPWQWLIVCIGIACIVLALMFMTVWKGPYWRYVLFLTPAIVLLEGMDTSIPLTAEHRLIATLIGSAAALLTIAALYPFVSDRLKNDTNAAAA